MKYPVGISCEMLSLTYDISLAKARKGEQRKVKFEQEAAFFWRLVETVPDIASPIPLDRWLYHFVRCL